MPRYYFDVQDGFEFKDDKGREIPNAEDVRAEAMKVISELSTSESQENDGYTIIVNVRDENSAYVLTIRMVCQIDESPRRHLKIAS